MWREFTTDDTDALGTFLGLWVEILLRTTTGTLHGHLPQNRKYLPIFFAVRKGFCNFALIKHLTESTMDKTNSHRFRDVAVVITALVLVLLIMLSDLTVLLGFLLIPCAYIYLKMQPEQKSGKAIAVPSFGTVEAMVAFYGQPDGAILADATRANEPCGVIYCYFGPRLVVADGIAILERDIEEITLENTATPYTNGQFQVVIATRLADRPTVKVNCGRDASFAADVVGELYMAVRHMRQRKDKSNS